MTPSAVCDLMGAQVRIVKHAFDIIHLLTDQNPVQVCVDAIINRCVPPAVAGSQRCCGLQFLGLRWSPGETRG